MAVGIRFRFGCLGSYIDIVVPLLYPNSLFLRKVPGVLSDLVRWFIVFPADSVVASEIMTIFV